jgi:protease I
VMGIDGTRVAFVATDGVEQIELTRPWEAIEAEGGLPRLVSPKDDVVQGFDHLDKADTFEVDVPSSQARPDDFDALVLPGGVANPDMLRMDEDTVAFVRSFVDAGKPIAAICHAPWTLIEAHAVVGRRLTSWPSLKTDLANAGADWVDQEVVVCDAQPSTLVTSRKPDDLDAFCKTMVQEFGA